MRPAVVNFSLLGFPVHVLPGFWLLLGLLGLWVGGESLQLGLMVAGVAFVSVLAHELGHAVVARGFGLKPQITLHMMGGATMFAPGRELTRGRDMLVSFSGPAAGFLLGGVALFLFRLYAPSTDVELSSPFLLTLLFTSQINFFWSAMNLIPVVPFDGGRILSAALGPERRQMSATISLAIGLGAAAIFLRQGWVIAAFLFASSALSSFFRMRQKATQQPAALTDQTLQQALRAARQALASEAFDQAAMLATGVAQSSADEHLRAQAIEVLLWASLGAKENERAQRVLDSHGSARLDPYVVAAVKEANSEPSGAAEVLKMSRERGDQRVEVAALYVKVLLQLERFASAAQVTAEILERISPEDVRRVAEQARAGGAEGDAARLDLALARTQRSFADASRAVFGFAALGADEEAAQALELAMEFDSQKARRLLDDARLERFRAQVQS